MEDLVPAVDENALEKLRQLQRPGRPSLLQRVVILYLEGSPQQLLSLEQALDVGDASALAFTAHKFKSESANVGAMRLASYLQDLECMARQDNIVDAGEIIEEVVQEFDKVRELLEQIDEAT